MFGHDLIFKAAKETRDITELPVRLIRAFQGKATVLLDMSNMLPTKWEEYLEILLKAYKALYPEKSKGKIFGTNNGNGTADPNAMEIDAAKKNKGKEVNSQEKKAKPTDEVKEEIASTPSLPSHVPRSESNLAPVVGSSTFQYDAEYLDEYLTAIMQFWRGEREPQGVEIEDANRCK